MGRIKLKGYTVDYDDEEASVSVGGKVLERFATVEGGRTALSSAQQWIKTQSQAPVETDKGVFDANARDEFGNLLPAKLPDPPKEPATPPVDPPSDEVTT